MGLAGGCAEHAGHRGAAPASQAESGRVSVDEKTGFVSLTSLRGQTPDPQQALAEIRRIYFNTTRQTIQNDLAHAIELLKSLPTEEEREKAAVYMDGLAQMRSDWARKEKQPAKGEVRARPAKVPKKP